jgi:transposase
MDEITEEPAALVERIAALDIGKATLTVCVRVPHDDKPGARRQEVRTYATLTPALLELRDWLICQGVTLVVMEATSAYWKPPFYLLEDDIACQVVNARDVKNVPGRPETDLLTELTGRSFGWCVRSRAMLARFRPHGQRRGYAAGVVRAGGAAARLA